MKRKDLAVTPFLSGVLPAAVMIAAAPAPSNAPLVPNPAPAPPPGLQPTAEMLLAWLKWGGIVGGLVGLDLRDHDGGRPAQPACVGS
jgi:hypothetical protein